MSEAPRVLVCDDHVHVARPVVVLLQAAGYDAAAASSALECLSLARARKPALILMDVMMPGMDGAFAASLFKEEPELEAIPIVLFSAMPEDELVAVVGRLAGEPPRRAAAV